MPAVAVCVKWIDRQHGPGLSLADEAAVEVALWLASAWGVDDVVAVSAAPVEADVALRDLLACGVSEAVRIDLAPGAPSAAVASALSAVLAGLGADVVVCGDLSADRGSGTVPAYLAHHLDASQALGLVAVTPGAAVGQIGAVRRLDGGRREILELAAPAVLSVEGSVAELRRAPLGAQLAARSEAIPVIPGPMTEPDEEPVRREPWRPRARVLPGPVGDRALDRVVALTGAMVDRTPPRTVELDPPDAADAILDQLRTWGYLS